MGIKCPKCESDSPDTSTFCADCGTKLPSQEEALAAATKTLETPVEVLTRGTLFAGRYEIIEELGKGGMGKVYRVEDTKIKQEMALKLIKPEIAAEKKVIERFKNELKTARDIRHKNVCGMFDLGEEKGSFYITMEYVPGGDLKRLIRRTKRLDTGTAISIAIQVCEGLTEAHGLGIVHRDLKPNNIMLDDEGRARIMDFGIARSLKEKGITGAGVMIGTPEYMSPEQVEGKEIDQRSDIYSLGVILYEMVTGQVPFEGDTPFTIGVKHKSERPKDPKELNDQIPNDLNSAILKCLEKDKEKRYKSAEELGSELSNIEAGIPTTEREIPRKKPLTSREITVTFGMKKMLVPALIFIGVVLVGLIIWQLLPEKKIAAAEKIENSIAVITFKNQTGDIAFDYLQEVIPNLLITNLENSGSLHVATWERMRDLLKQTGRGDEKTINEDLGFDLCRREGIEAIVLGFFTKAGNTFVTDAKVLDVESKKLLKSASSRGDGIDSILKNQIDYLSREITQGIGIAKQAIEKGQPKISEVTTTSLEAYDYYLKGRDAYDKFYFDDSQKLLEKAVEIDPTFAVAYLFLARTYNQFGSNAERDEAYEKAKMYSEKASEKERLYIEAEYARRIEGNQEKRVRILEQIAETYPKEKRVYYLLGVHYHSFDTDKAIELYNKGLELDPNYGNIWNQLGYLYSDLGDFEKAVDCLQKYASLLPWDANPIDSIAELYFRMGRLDDAIEKYKEALEIKPDFGAEFRIAYVLALKEEYSETPNWIEQFIERAEDPETNFLGNLWKNYYYFWIGELNQSLSGFQGLSDFSKMAGLMDIKAVIDWMMGWIHYDQGNHELSQEYFKKAFDRFLASNPSAPDNLASYKFYQGLIALEQGQLDSARSRLAEIDALLPEVFEKETVKFGRDFLLTEVLLAEGNPQEAIVIYKQITPVKIPSMRTELILPYNVPFMRDTLARAYVQARDLDRAIAEYNRLVTFDPNSKDRRIVHPRHHYRLAVLYEKSGQNAKAVETFEKFLTLWKGADPDLPEVVDAKKRLSALK